MNNIIAEAKSVFRQFKTLNKLHKANPNSSEFESYKYMEEQRVKTNLKRIIPSIAIIFAYITILLILYYNQFFKAKYQLFADYRLLYIISASLLTFYIFLIARLMNSKKLNIRVAKYTYMSFWSLYEVVFCAFLIISYIDCQKFQPFLVIIILMLVVPIFDKLESLIIIYLSAIASVVIVCILDLPLGYLVMAIPLLVACALVFVATYYARMKILHTQSVIEQRGLLAQRKIKGIFNDLFDEVYEINLNTNEFTLVHSKGTFQSSHMKDSYEKSMGYITNTLLHPNDVEAYQRKFCAENLKREFKDGKKQIYQESRRLKINGDYAWVSTLIIREYSINEDEYKLMQLVQDIDSRKVSENKLKIEAQRDPLTMLYNKSTTQKMIEEYIENEGSDGVHAFIIIDMDSFKDINDTKGHFAGDDVLIALSDKLRKYFRESDILGRIGGDEFVAFIKNIQSIALVCDKVQKLASALKMYGIESEYSHRLSTSMGIAIYNKDGRTYEELYKNADKALYEAKRNGKDQYKFCIREDMQETK